MDRPLPSLDGLTGEWYGHCRRGELRFQRCAACGRWRHPPRLRCPACGSDEWEWERSTGRGTLFSWTVTHQAFHPAFAELVPYVVAVIELDEGVRMIASLRDVDGAPLRLSLPVEVGWEKITDDVTLPVFSPRWQ